MSLAEVLKVIDAGGSVALAIVVWLTLRWGFTMISKSLDGMRDDMREDRREVVDAVQRNAKTLARVDERTIAIVKQTRPRPPNGGNQ